jgi:hypothetical protein
MVVSLLLPVVLAAGCSGGGGGGGNGGGGGASSSKAITAFSIVGIDGTIDENAKTIAVTVPYGTDITALAATFTTTGTSVIVGNTEQVDGVTKNNFSKVLFYVVNAAGGTTQVYTVTVTGNVALGTPITSSAVPPITSFGQSLPSNDTGTLNAANGYYQEIFPGQANLWDIDLDFTLFDGGDYQFSYALYPYFTDGSTFGTGATYTDLTFSGPVMRTAQGVKVAAVSDGASTMGVVSALTGSYAAFLNATSDSRLMQPLILPSVTGTITLTWEDSVNLYEGNFSGYPPSYRVVIRDTGGVELEELYATTDTTSTSGGSHLVDLTAYRGQNIVLSFEERSMPFVGSLTMIDAVSVIDSDTSTEHVTNGGFESGLTGWTTNTPAEVQNMATTNAENHAGLDVKRSFYTVPNKLWGRWADVFENNTSSAITTTVDYETVLGTYGTAIIYDTPATGKKAITVWEGTQTARDTGMVFGNADRVVYTSDDGLSNGNGSDTIDFYYTITVPPGGRLALVNFIILGTYDTSLTALDTSAKATEIDTEAQNIVAHFWTDSQYRDGMTQQQIDAIKNF